VTIGILSRLSTTVSLKRRGSMSSSLNILWRARRGVDVAW
jgi:hypothetical protein